MKNMNELLKQAQKMQGKITKLQEELEKKTVEASAGGGMVTAVANGRGDIISVTIEREVVDPEEVGMLEDLVTAAVNEAINRSREMVQEEMSKLTGGMNIPGLF
ncbi:MAG: YbaB/EbfC family nucleoid-associated protein [Deltaproteobacteria bacterium]|nr:YbaB/EbfC family nucleoid-associated protein [Deltaproteobacteria bacterium]NIS78435.1 YbaB/EbfC family nucleoid-associated protein [Deltaproteobacteria bacterium]